MHAQARVHIGHLLQLLLSILFFESRSLTEPGAHLCGNTGGWTERLWAPPLSVCQALGLQVHIAAAALCMNAED